MFWKKEKRPFRTLGKIITKLDVDLKLTKQDLEFIKIGMEKDGHIRKVVDALIDYSDDSCKILAEIDLSVQKNLDLARTLQARIAATQWLISIFESLEGEQKDADGKSTNTGV